MSVFVNTPQGGKLTAAQVDQFRRDGYLAVPGFFDPAPILAHAKQVIAGFDPAGHPMTRFSTGGDEGKAADKHVGDQYFLESGDKVRYFLEEDAVDANGRLNRAPELAVNKCGHALHALDPVFARFSFSDELQAVARSLDVHKDPRVLQSMIIAKQPSIGGTVPIHNDSTFLYTNPPSAVGFWFALEDCTANNGTLSFLPGSHRWPKGSVLDEQVQRPQEDPDVLKSLHLGPARGVNKRFIRTHTGDSQGGTTFETLSTDEEAEWDEKTARLEEIKAGTLVLIHGSVLHKSEKNLSSISRYIYTFHMIEGKHPYDAKNWLQPTEKLPFTKLFDPPQSVKDLIAGSS